MRHAKHRFILGATKAHRIAMMSNMAIGFFKHGRMKTTLAKAKALRPFVEHIITLAKKAAQTENPADKLHYRRLALAKVRDESVIKELFTEGVKEFMTRSGGYTRIFKLGRRIGDAAEVALIQIVKADDEGFQSRTRRKLAKKSMSIQASPVASSSESTVA